MHGRKAIWMAGLIAMLLMILAACGGSDPTATTLPTSTAAASPPPAAAAELSAEEDEYLGAVRDAQLLTVRVFAGFQQIFGQTYPVREALLAALLEAGVGTPFIGNLAALEALDPPQRFRDDHRIWLEANRGFLRIDAEAAQAVRDGDLVTFVHLNGDLGGRNVRARLALSPVFCRSTATDPQAAANCVPEAPALSGEYLIGLNDLLREFMPDFASSLGTLAFRLSLTPEEMGQVLSSMGAVTQNSGQQVESALDTMTPPDELLADHERMQTYFNEVLEIIQGVGRLREDGNQNEARLELQRIDQPLCKARESFESNAFKEAVAIFFADGQGACANTPFLDGS